jgi:hypothetical protein
MLTRIKRLPSPALVIGVIALVVAVGGGAFAIASSDKQQDKKIAKKVVQKAAPNLSVAHATTADSAGSAFTGFSDNGVSLPGTLTGTGNPIATLPIGKAGSYLVIASLAADNIDSAAGTVQCKLQAGGNSDTVDIIVPGSAFAHEESLTLQTQHTFSAPGQATLSCTDSNDPNVHVSAFSIRIQAIQVGSVSSKNLG